jgi:hypothetical protein
MQMATTTDTTNSNVTPLRRQQQLPGIGRDIPEVEAAAIALRDIRVERKALQEKEAELQDALIATMASHEVEAFEFDDGDDKYVARIKTGKTKASVRKAKNADDDNEDV